MNQEDFLQHRKTAMQIVKRFVKVTERSPTTVRHRNGVLFCTEFERGKE